MKVTDSNEWIKRDEGSKRAKVGLTKRAAQELDEIVFVKLPNVGMEFNPSDEAVVLESLKAAADSYAPIKGRVVAINEKLLANPNLVTQDPYGEGWLYEIEFDSEDDYHALADHA